MFSRASQRAAAGKLLASVDVSKLFIARSGARFTLGGHPYVFSGINIYEANSDYTATRGCGGRMQPGTYVTQALNDIGTPYAYGSGQIIRTWFFQRYTVNGSSRDWTYFDNTLDQIKAAGYRVIVTLGNQWSDGEVTTTSGPNWTSNYRTSSWYQTGYKTVPDPGMLTTYRDWVQALVTRYKDRPEIAFWQLMNEAGTSDASDGTPAVTLLRNFADDVGGLIKSIDSNHLVSFGSIGTGQGGTANGDYTTVHASSAIDMCEVHDYSPNSTTLAGDQYNGLAVRFQQAASLNKPIFVGEFGNEIGSSGASTMADRATLYTQKFNTYFSNGAAGAVVWNFTLYANTSNGSIDVGAGDPALAVIHQYGLRTAT